jgi:hypothetical protein
MDTPLPKLRAIEAFAVDVEAKPLVCLRDPLRYATAPLLVPLAGKFGDRDGLTPELLARTEAKDRRLISTLERGDRQGFFREIAADADQTRICGAAPLMTFLEVLGDIPGRLLHYAASRDDGTRSAVTFASLAFGPP